MDKTSKGMRLHIAVFGRRNVGKSSVVNALTGQQVSIVSERAGTTTDPVEKAMELLPLGPVLFIDTAGVDDTGDLGRLRVDRTMAVFEHADLALLVGEGLSWDCTEETLYEDLKKRGISVLVVLNKADIAPPPPSLLAELAQRGDEAVTVSAVTGFGIDRLREKIIQNAPEESVNLPSILGDLLPPGEVAVFVVPIDLEAPKGRLILPQVQAIRDVLDNDGCVMVVKESRLRAAFNGLKKPPALVVTDSQAFEQVAADVPIDVPLTSFSILFARFKGDLAELARGAKAIDDLVPGDRVLVCEACTHHPVEDDIGRVKIPRWLSQRAGGKLDFKFCRDRDLPEDIAGYRLIVHCGACMWNRRAMLSRILKARQNGVPITNYGMAIAHSLRICERALRPFPRALEAYRERN